MKILCLLFLIVLISVASYGQQEEVSKWQRLHPTVTCIEQLDFSLLKEEAKQLIGEKILVYNDVLTLSDIRTYEKAKVSTQKKGSILNKSEHQAYLKNWLGNHSEVKIIRRSTYDELDPARRSYYLNNHHLILTGEMLTMEDVQQYEITQKEL